MDTFAATAASQALQKARACLETMKNSKQPDTFHQAWSEFLSAAHRIFSKLEQGAKTNGTSGAWFGRRIHERRTDPLLAYIHHARNSDEHGLAELSRVEGRKLGAPYVESVFTLGTLGRGPRRVADVTMIPIEIDPASAKMFPIVDRGCTYDPPTEHLGKKIDNPSPITVGELTLAFLETMVAEARRLP
jgi:hypothetical protein